MNDTQQNQFDAAEVTYNYLQDAAQVPIWTPLEAFDEGVTAAGGSINILHTLIQIQAGKTEGITANKDRLRLSLSNRLVKAAKAAVSFGNGTNNADLAAQASGLDSPSEIKAIKDGLLADTATAFHQKALAARDADPATAAKYGFKTGALDKLLAPLLSTITAYSGVVRDPQSAVNTRAGATAAIDTELRRLLGILGDLDNLAPQFEDEHPDFVAGYQRARQIIARGSGKSTPPPSGEDKDKGGSIGNAKL